MQSTNPSDARGTIAAMLALMALMMAAMLTMFVRQDEFRSKQVRKATSSWRAISADVDKIGGEVQAIHEELKVDE